ncbi:ABC transporter ATP-binding protein [Nocardiopsis sp. EMB25]|uniref:ABC transporter ATP-binding protein n=1 Tax=Nocardiopsis sp. EMB25 TaxID=2835867 RepID=UPI002285324D|nr:ABC transporter ATP-binding protein [Nocardiopsis sp. EMB25]MCY9783297.1 ABC transporter ATP-binding protein [Nocardiopsis sp. EMB25]
MNHLLRVDGATVDYTTRHGLTRALDGADLTVAPGERVGLVGESGSGKSTLGLLVGRLLPSNVATGGTVAVDGRDVLSLDPRELRDLRRRVLGFIPQDPVGALDPTLRVGRQMRLALRGSAGEDRNPVDLLERVRIDRPDRVLRLYPHEISGGMAQRIVIATVMAAAPRLLVADEPTAALDAQSREEVTGLVMDLAGNEGTGVLWLSHDLRAVGRWCDRTAVMYGGRVVEDGATRTVLDDPRHPYTRALSQSDPAHAVPGRRLPAITGGPPTLAAGAEGCAFAPRCPRAVADCEGHRPLPRDVDGRTVLCLRPESQATAPSDVKAAS